MVFRPSGTLKIPRITPSQWGVLMFIEEHGKSTVVDVAKALNITSSATTQLVDGLVASGYVMRETQIKDRRAVVLTLSKKTKTVVDKMKKKALQNFLNFFEVLNDKEFDQYILLNKKITERFLKK
jgi:DNA-binding MarR family transcriptional regulator